MKKLFTILFILFITFSTVAQREKNNIYLFDCTGSMKTNGLWNPAKAALEATIITQSNVPNSQFTIIPFGDNAYQSFSFNSGQYNLHKQNIEDAFEKYINQARYTHISDVLNAGVAKVDEKKENKIYLLTDGKPNNGDTPQKVAETITNWCSNHKNTRLFYVALTNGVVDPIIKAAIDGCSDAFIVQCYDKVIPQIADISSDVYTNIEELNHKKEISFNIPGSYDIDVISDDPIFDVIIHENKATNGKILISLKPKDGFDLTQIHQQLGGDDYEFYVSLQCKDKRYFIANPIVTVHVSDEVPIQLILANNLEEINVEGITWHDSFLWSTSSEDKSIEWDLSPIFKNQLQDTQISLKFSLPEGEKEDFQAWYNNKPLKIGDVIKLIPGEKAIIRVLFNHNAQEGKRYFELKPENYNSLNMVNNFPIEKFYGTTLSTEYKIGWNPLKTIMFWIGIGILILLMLWFLVIRRMVFPKIKMSKIQLTGPNSYYLSKKIKGARKIVLTSKRKSQSFLSRIFTGEIRYIKSELFNPELIILPSGAKKKVKLQTKNKLSDGWEIYPSAIFNQYDHGTLTNRTTNDITNIEFN